jgi:hypothetical protein
MGFYDEMKAVADELLGEFAQGTVTLSRVVQTPAVNDWDEPSEAVTAYTLQAVVRGVSKQFIDGTTILATDLQATVAVPSVVPVPNDLLLLDGDAVTVLRVDAIPAVGTVCAYRLFLRR